MATTTHYFKSLLLCSILLTTSVALMAQAETQNPSSAAGTYWRVRGNANTTASTAAIGATVNNNFIGTTNSEAFVLVANNMERMRLDGSNFLIGIGQTAPQYAFDLKVNPDAVYPCGRNGLRILQPAYSNACNNGLFLGISGDNPDNAMLWNMSGSGSNAEYLSIGLNDPGVAANEVIRVVSHAVNINSPVNTEAVLNLMDNSTTKMHGIMVSYAGNAPGTRGTFFGLSSLGLNDDAIIWNYRNNAILFGTNNTQRVEISNAGNVGINVTGAPSYLLDVQGNTGVNPMRVRGVLTGATTDSLLTINSSGLVRRMKASDMFAATSTDWSLTGNASTVDGVNFIGTTDNVPFTIKVNSQQAGRLDPLLSNSFYGYWAGRDNSTGTQNTAVGINALLSNATGVKNTALGTSALENNTGSNNTATGYAALTSNTSGSYNTATGFQSAAGVTTGNRNTAVGYAAFATPSGNNSGVVAIGNYALYNTNQDNSVAVGDSALAYNGGAGNTGVGYRALTAVSGGFNNTAVGFEAGKANSGVQNITAIGYQALGSSTGGYSNTAVGSRALYNDAGGMYNNALGHEALYTNNTGADNTAVGYHSLYSNTSGSNNTAVGNYAGNGMTNSSNNVAIGYNAMYSTGNVSGSVAIGRAALSSAATYDAVAIGDSALAFNAGQGNTAVGNKTLIVNNAGSYNTVLGYEAARRTTGMSYNTALGYQSMGGFPGGIANTSVGAQALYTGNGSSYNAAVGYKAMYSTNGAGDNNAALGSYSLYSNVTGRNNTAVGYQAAYSNSTGYSNVAVGKDALYNGSTVRNTVAVGDSALFNNGTTPSATLGQFNTAVGSKAMLTNNTGASNTALGFEALYSNATTNSNTAVGRGALRATTGNYSTSVGALAASSNTGDGNTAVGYITLTGNTTGTFNTALGYAANVSGTNLTNATAIGANATVAGSNMMVLGDVGLNAVNVGIGLTNPAQRLHVFNNKDVNKNSIYSDAEQVSISTDYQNNAIVGYGRGGNATWGYANGVMGIGDQANSYFAIGVYAGLESAVPTLPATDAALYANGANVGYAGVFMNGNVGIGTSTPATRLVVTGDGNGKASIGGGFCGGDYTGISLNGLAGSCTVYNMLSSSSDQNLYFNRPTGYAMAFRENNADQMYITSGGNIGIGTTNPGLVKLFVCGDVSINGLLRVSSTISSSGGFGCPSDIRYKKNITPLNHALANVTKLQGVNYYWKTDEFAEKKFTNDRQIGFIAQETEKVFPEMVITDKDGFKMVDYARITPVLVEAIKELNEKNTALEKKIERLENALAHSNLLQKGEHRANK